MQWNIGIKSMIKYYAEVSAGNFLEKYHILKGKPYFQ